MSKIRPRIFISKCIELEACRWNGAIISSPEVNRLFPFIDIITACPEADIGLGIPRDPVHLEYHDQEICLVQPATQKNFTETMKSFAQKISNNWGDMDGFILKSKSPSCGIKEVKVYSGPNSKSKSGISAGIFAQFIMNTFPDIMIEDEGRLTNLKIRDHFFTAIFSLARFRTIKERLKMSELVEFHANHKYLYLSINQSQMRVLGRIVANHDKLSNELVFDEYHKQLKLLFKSNPRIKNIINVWMHILGYFSNQLSSPEKVFILQKMDEYAQDIIPASVVTELLHSLCIRFNHEYLLKQFFFNPFPKELHHIHDSAKRRI